MKKKARASPPSADLAFTPPPVNNNLVTLAAAATTLATAATALATAATTLVGLSPDDAAWALNANGIMRTPCARRKAKSRQLIPAVEAILQAGDAVQQGAVLCALTDHPLMASARKMAAIYSPKEIATANYIVGQSARMMERNRRTEKMRGNTTAVKRDAVEVILAFAAPSPQKQTMSVPSRRDRARALGVPSSTLA
jgi:hypothetical protein